MSLSQFSCHVGAELTSSFQGIDELRRRLQDVVVCHNVGGCEERGSVREGGREGGEKEVSICDRIVQT